MKTFRPMIAVWGLAAGILWAAMGPATAGADPAAPATAVKIHEQLQDSPELQGAATRAIDGGADRELLSSLILRGREENLPNEVLLPWVEHVESVALRRLPTAPVLSRYLEGIAKSVPVPRIDAAIRVLENRLELAAQRVDAVYPPPSSRDEERARLAAIDHAAYALGLSGMNEEFLDRSLALALADEDPMGEVESPVLTLGILVSSGIQPERSLEVVSVAWNHGYRGNDLERLGKAVGRLRNDGGSPDVVETVLKMIGSDASREEVFRGLDDLTGRGDYTSPGLAPGDDPTIRRGDTNRDLDPPAGSAPKDPAQPKPVGGHF